jgi:hypothetical protein
MTPPDDETRGPTKSVLVIADLYHSSPRIPVLAKYLKERGWNASIITPSITDLAHFNAPAMKDLEGIPIFQVGEPSIYESRKQKSRVAGRAHLLKGIQEKLDPTGTGGFRELTDRLYWKAYGIFNYPDPQKGWRMPGTEVALKIASGAKFDAVLSSSSPVTAHFIARAVSQELAIPWIAEFRDLWSQNHNTPFGPFMRWYTRRLEMTTLKNANAIVTVSPLWAKDLSKLHGKRVDCLTNGFDPQYYSPCPKLPGKFVITYTGQIYWGKQNPSLVLEAISSLVSEGSIKRESIELRFFGPKDKRLDVLVENFELTGIVRQFGVVPREESIARQCESGAVLLLAWDDPTQPGWVPLKLVEYLGCCNPILATGGSHDSIIAEILRKTSTGVLCSNRKETRETLLLWYDAYFSERWPVVRRNANEVRRYDFSEIARDYASLLNEVSKAGSHVIRTDV